MGQQYQRGNDRRFTKYLGYYVLIEIKKYFYWNSFYKEARKKEIITISHSLLLKSNHLIVLSSRFLANEEFEETAIIKQTFSI